MGALCIVALPPIRRGMLPSLDLLRGLHIAAVPHCRHRRPGWFARDHEGVTGTLYRRPAAALQCLPVALQFRRCLDYVCIGASQTSQSATHVQVEGFLHGDCMTCTGKTLAENLEPFPAISEIVKRDLHQEVLWPVQRPYKPAGNHILVLHGNLCTESAICKLSGKENVRVALAPEAGTCSVRSCA